MSYLKIIITKITQTKSKEKRILGVDLKNQGLDANIEEHKGKKEEEKNGRQHQITVLLGARTTGSWRRC